MVRPNSKYIVILFSLFLAMFFVYVANGVLITSTGLTLKDMGFNSTQIGVINTAYFAGLVLGTITNGKLIGRVGHARSFTFFLAVYIFALLLHNFVSSSWHWSILRILIGISAAGTMMVIESWLNARVRNEIRGKILSVYSMSFYIAYGLSAYLLSMELSFSNLITLVAIFASVAIIPISLTKIKQPVLPKTHTMSIPKVAEMVPLALAASFLAGITINGFYTMASVYIINYGYGAKETSLFITLAVLGAFLVQLPLGKLSDKFGRRVAIICTSSIALTFSLLAFVFYKFIYFQYVASFFLGGSMFTFYSLGLARANDKIPNGSNSMEVSRSLLLVYSIGSVIAPLLIGGLINRIGNFSFMLVFATCSLILLLIAIKQDNANKENRQKYNSIMPFSPLFKRDYKTPNNENGASN